jgi:cytochrome oxidase Cu insertion factor (SCO1/SenC/PrrC family)
VGVLAVVFVVTASFGLFACAPTGDPVGSGSAAGSSKREAFPDFELTGTDGKSVDKAALAGKPSIIWFTDTAFGARSIVSGRIGPER